MKITKKIEGWECVKRTKKDWVCWFEDMFEDIFEVLKSDYAMLDEKTAKKMILENYWRVRPVLRKPKHATLTLTYEIDD